MTSKCTSEAKDLETLQREYRNMEVNRKSLTEVLQKQQQTLETLRRENQFLKSNVATMEANAALKPVTFSEHGLMETLYSEIEKYTSQIQTEQSRISSMEEQISALRDKVWHQQKEMGGVNAATENHCLVQKQAYILENRIDQALVKFNKSLAHNCKLRKEIDHLRGERVAFEGIHKKKQKELEDKKKKMAQVIEQSNLAYEHQDKAQLEITAIAQKTRKEFGEHEQKMTELGRMLGDELKLGRSGHMAPLWKDVSAEGKKVMSAKKKKALLRENALREQVQQLKERTQNFEEEFSMITVATGNTDTEELVAAFLANEDQIVSLSEYTNEQASDIEHLERQVHELRKEEARHAKESDSDIGHYERILDELNTKLEASEKQADKLEEKIKGEQIMINKLKEGIQTLLDMIGYKNDMPITEANILHFLGTIEQRTNEILSSHYAMKRQSAEQSSLALATAAATVPAKDICGEPSSPTAESHTVTTTARHSPLGVGDAIRPSIIGAGPSTPMGGLTNLCSVNAPDTRDYSSDDGSCGDDGAHIHSAVTQPLTRDEIRVMTASRRQRRRTLTEKRRRESTLRGRQASVLVGL